MNDQYINKNFGTLKTNLVKNIIESDISIHPDFLGIYKCYEEIFHCLETDLTLFKSEKTFDLWSTSDSANYYLVYGFHFYFNYLIDAKKNWKIHVRALPKDTDGLNALKQLSSREFIELIRSFRFDIHRMNPTALHKLINDL